MEGNIQKSIGELQDEIAEFHEDFSITIQELGDNVTKEFILVRDQMRDYKIELSMVIVH